MPGCRCWCALLLLLSLAPAAAAVEGTTLADRATMTVVPRPVHTLTFGINYQQYDLQRQTDYPWVTSEVGPIPSYVLHYQYHGDRTPLFIQAGLEYANASITYQVEDERLRQSTSSGTDHSFIDYQGLIGWTLHPEERTDLAITPYVGLGYYTWKRQLQIREKYTWFYLAFGARCDYQLGSGWEVGLDLSGRRQIDPTKYVTLYDIMPNVPPPLENHQLGLKTHTGWRASLPLTYRYSDGLAVTLMPWGEVTLIGKSDGVPITDGAGAQWQVTYDGITRVVDQEPASRLYRYGAQVALTF